MSAPNQQRGNGHQSQHAPQQDGTALLDQIIRQSAPQKLQAVKRNLEARVNEMEHLLPPYMKGQAARLIKRAMLTFNRNPKLQGCTPDSLFWCVLNAAEVGLQIDGKLAHAVPYWNNGKKCNEAQFQPDYKGLIAVARRSGVIVDIYAELVREGDKFTHGHKGGECVLEHYPAISGRGAVLGAYAVVKLRDGWHYEWMDRSDLDGIKARSKSRSRDGKLFGPWVTDEGEMQRKTVIRRILKQFCDDQCLGRIMDHMDKEYMEDQEAAALNVVLEATQARVSAGPAPSQSVPDTTDSGEIIEDMPAPQHEPEPGSDFDLDAQDRSDDLRERIGALDKGADWSAMHAEITRAAVAIGSARVEELMECLRNRRAAVEPPATRSGKPTKAEMHKEIVAKAAATAN